MQEPRALVDPPILSYPPVGIWKHGCAMVRPTTIYLLAARPDVRGPAAGGRGPGAPAVRHRSRRAIVSSSQIDRRGGTTQSKAYD